MDLQDDCLAWLPVWPSVKNKDGQLCFSVYCIRIPVLNMGMRRRNYGPPRRKSLNDGRLVRLNLRRVDEVKYELRRILGDSTTDEKFVQSFLATMIAKASRESMSAAKEYVREKCAEGMIDPEIEAKILKVMDRNTKYR